MACQPQQTLLTVEDLHFPIDPERDALRDNGIREVIEVCVSEGGCFQKNSYPSGDTMNMYFYDTLGQKVHASLWFTLDAPRGYFFFNDLGWPIVDDQTNDHNLFYLYSYYPKSRTLFQYYCTYHDVASIVVWKFDKTGNLLSSASWYSTSKYGYDSIGRLISIHEVVDSIAAINTKHIFGIETNTQFKYHGNSKVLAQQTYVALDTAGAPLRRSYTKTYTPNGLPYEQVDQSGRVRHYILNTSTSDYDRARAIKWLPEPWRSNLAEQYNVVLQ